MEHFGLVRNGQEQLVSGIHVYPADYFNPLDSVTTVTVQIVQMLTGEGSFDHPATLSAFALGMVLFIVTLILNIIALRVVKKFREAYD